MIKKLLTLILVSAALGQLNAKVTLHYNNTSAEMSEDSNRSNTYKVNITAGSESNPITDIYVTVDDATYSASETLRTTESATLSEGSTDKVTLNGESTFKTNQSSSLDFFFNTDTKVLTVVDCNFPLYLRSSLNGWGSTDSEKMTYTNGTYSLWFNDIDKDCSILGVNASGENGFKIAQGNEWQLVYGASETVKFGEETNAVLGGNNIKLEQTPSYFAVLFDAVEKTVKAVVPLFLRGNGGDYTPQEKYRFKPFQDYQNTYVLDFGTDTQITGSFKIADDNWTYPFNFGDAYGSGRVQQLKYSGGGDVDASTTFGDLTTDKIYARLYKDKEEVRCILYYGLPEQIYAIGWDGNWDKSNPPVTLVPVSGTEWIYKNTEPLDLSGEVTFRIFDNTASDFYTTSWGYNGDADGYEPTFSTNGQNSEPIQLIKGWGNNVKLTSSKRKGPFTLTFDLLNGQLSILNHDTSSISEMAADAAKVVVNGGVITAGDKLMNVYTVSGALVAANAKSVAAARGLYIVVVDGAAQKVAVK